MPHDPHLPNLVMQLGAPRCHNPRKFILTLHFMQQLMSMLKLRFESGYKRRPTVIGGIGDFAVCTIKIVDCPLK
jgi:hypothetical protein